MQRSLSCEVRPNVLVARFCWKREGQIRKAPLDAATFRKQCPAQLTCSLLGSIGPPHPHKWCTCFCRQRDHMNKIPEYAKKRYICRNYCLLLFKRPLQILRSLDLFPSIWHTMKRKPGAAPIIQPTRKQQEKKDRTITSQLCRSSYLIARHDLSQHAGVLFAPQLSATLSACMTRFKTCSACKVRADVATSESL